MEVAEKSGACKPTLEGRQLQNWLFDEILHSYRGQKCGAVMHFPTHNVIEFRLRRPARSKCYLSGATTTQVS